MTDIMRGEKGKATIRVSGKLLVQLQNLGYSCDRSVVHATTENGTARFPCLDGRRYFKCSEVVMCMD